MADESFLATLQGSQLVDADGDKVGTIQNVYLDDDTDEPTFAAVRCGLFGSMEVFVPLDMAEATERGVQVPFQKQYIMDAPPVPNDGAITPEEEMRIYDYFPVEPTEDEEE